MIAAEFGTAADPSNPGSRIAWLQAAETWLSGHPEVIGGWYFDHGTGGGFHCDWALDARGNALVASLWASSG